VDVPWRGALGGIVVRLVVELVSVNSRNPRNCLTVRGLGVGGIRCDW
jgi:hypothetical protein